MSAQHQDIFDFVTQQAPFNALPGSACDYFTHHLEVIYVTRENQHQWLDSAHPKLFLLRSGVIELVAADGEPIARLTSGDYFGYPSLLSGETIKNRIEVKREALAICSRKRTSIICAMNIRPLSNTLSVLTQIDSCLPSINTMATAGRSEKLPG